MKFINNNKLLSFLSDTNIFKLKNQSNKISTQREKTITHTLLIYKEWMSDISPIEANIK